MKFQFQNKSFQFSILGKSLILIFFFNLNEMIKKKEKEIHLFGWEIGFWKIISSTFGCCGSSNPSNSSSSRGCDFLLSLGSWLWGGASNSSSSTEVEINSSSISSTSSSLKLLSIFFFFAYFFFEFWFERITTWKWTTSELKEKSSELITLNH